MGSKVVVTYKRKRLFSRSDHSHLHLHSNKHEDSIAECKLQHADIEHGIRLEHSKDGVGENVLQCGNCDSQYCGQHSEEHTTKRQDSSSSKGTQNLSLGRKIWSPKSDVKQIIFHPIAEDKSADTRSKVKLGSEYEDKCKEMFPIIPSPDPVCLKTSGGVNCSRQLDGTSISGKVTLEETTELNKDPSSSSCTVSGTKRKLTSTLITFHRRSKRNRDIVAPDIASEYAGMKNEKVNLTNSFIGNEDKKTPQDIPLNEMSSLQGKVCMDVQDSNHITVRSQSLSNKDENSRLLDLSVSPNASHDIDCNQPLDCGSEENHLTRPLEIVHDSIGWTSKIMENMPTLQVQCKENGSTVTAIGDKGKFVVDSSSVLTGTSTKNNYLQLFPENRSNDLEKSSQFQPSSLNFPCFQGSSLQSEQMLNSHTYYPSLYGWPSVHLHPREPFHDFLHSTSDRAQLFSRHKMMLDNILTRARAVRGNRNSFLDKFEPPTTWSEEELDSLWIGVRRHGRGNWEAILRDRRLNFSPWKTPRDLSERWEVEQAQLFYSMHVSQPKYTIPHDFSSDSLLHSRPKGTVNAVQLSLGVPKQPSVNFTNSGPVKGNLPHWLREAVEIPLRLSEPFQAAVSSVSYSGIQSNIEWMGNPPQLWTNNRYMSIQRRNERRGKAEPHYRQVNKKDDVVVIPSDASSEETISDDHSIRP